MEKTFVLIQVGRYLDWEAWSCPEGNPDVDLGELIYSGKSKAVLIDKLQKFQVPFESEYTIEEHERYIAIIRFRPKKGKTEART